MSADDLTEEIRSAKEELLDLRFQLATRQLKDVTAIRRTRRRIARATAAMAERETKSA